MRVSIYKMNVYVRQWPMDLTLWWEVGVRISANYKYGSRQLTKWVRVQIWGLQFIMIKGRITDSFECNLRTGHN